MKTVKLKKGIGLDKLFAFGFEEDQANCEKGDTYYHLNNYYVQKGDFRITVSTISGHVDILCLAKESGLYNMFDLTPLFDLMTSGLVEIED